MDRGQYVLITATKDGQRQVFQGDTRPSLIDPSKLWAYVTNMDNPRCRTSLSDICNDNGWDVERIDPMPENWVTERKEWNLGQDRVALEISDTLAGFRWRLRVNGDEGRWTRAQEVTSEDQRYAYFGEYWEGYFPVNTLIRLEQFSDAVFLGQPTK